jgi:hypothetical protein
MRKSLIIFIFSLTWINVFSQTWICGFEDSDKNVPDKSLLESISTDNSICVNVAFHIVRETDGTGGLNPTNIENIVNELNFVYNVHNIFINNVGFDFIDNSEYYSFDKNEEYSILNESHRQDALNIYTINTAPYQGSARRQYKSIYIDQDTVASRILHHELGHLFGLLHTHADNPNAIGVVLENIERDGSNANCEYAADGLCSTPADPYLAGKVNNNCVYILNETLNGFYYEPDVNNFMSYTLPHCMTHFYDEQVQLMHYYILNSGLLDGGVINTSCTFPSITGVNSICNLTQATYTIQNNNNPFIWEISSNLRKISSTSSTITVVPTSYMFSSGYIRANINGYIVEKNISIQSIPIINDHQISGGYDNVSFNSINAFYISDAYGASSYLWSIVPYSMSCSSYKLPYFISSNTGLSVSVNHGTCEGKYILRCMSNNSCGSSYYQDKVINVYDPYGDNDPCDATLSLYPNPSKKGEFTVLKIQYPDDPCDDELNTYLTVDLEHELSLYNISGNLLLQENFSSDTFIFKNAPLKKGVYIITVKDKKGKIHIKRLNNHKI